MKNKVLAILLSVVVAFGLWMYVITSVSPGSEETYYNIPVVMDGETLLAERNLMITGTSGNINGNSVWGKSIDFSAGASVKPDYAFLYQ